MKTKPPKPRREPGTLTALEKGLSLSKRQVSALLKLGMPEDVTSARQWRRERQEATPDFSAARARKMTADAARSELALAVSKGELIKRDQAQAEAVHDAIAVRGGLLALEVALPGKLLGLRTHSEIRALLHREFRNVLQLLSDGTYHRGEGVLEVVRSFHPDYEPTSLEER
jgi:hypothetical protein